MRSQATFFRAGGTMEPTAPNYIERGADRQLLEALAAQEYVYVLDSRQKGKSSLVARAIWRLRDRGVRTVKLDLQRFGANVSAEEWYAGLLFEVGADLALENELLDYWNSHRSLGPLARVVGALRDVVLVEIAEPIVVFVDEIDFVRALPFSTDEFFAAIRDCYNRRPDGLGFERLTFCIVGVATPSQLIRNPDVTPFNIGKRIDLSDFTLEETLHFTDQLASQGRDGQRLLKRIHYWVNGHPYLTQLLCGHVAANPEVRTERDVDLLCERLFLAAESRQREPNFADVERRMLEPDVPGLSPEERRTQVLDLYGRLLSGGQVSAAEENPIVATLRLSGLGLEDNGSLRLRNRTYKTVFDERWRRRNLPDAELRRQRSAARLAIFRTTAIAGVVILAISAAAVATYSISKDRAAALSSLQTRTDELDSTNYIGQMALIELAMERKRWARVRDLLEITKNHARRGWEWGYAAAHLAFDFRTSVTRGSVLEVQPNGTVAVVTGEGTYELTSGGTRLLSKHLPMNAEEADAYRKAERWGPHRVSLFRRGELRVWRDLLKQGLSVRNARTDQELVSATPETHIDDVDPQSRAYLIQGRNSREKIELRSIDGRRLLATFTSQNPIEAMSFVGDGSLISIGNSASPGPNVVLSRWDTSGTVFASVTSTLPSDIHSGYSICFSPSRALFAAYGGGSCEIRRTQDLELVVELPEAWIQGGVMAFSSDERLVAVGHEDGTVRLFDLRQSRPLRSFIGLAAVSSVAFLPGGKHVAAAAWDGEVRVWKVDDKPAMETVEDACAEFAFLTPDRKTLVSASKSGVITSRNLVTGKAVHLRPESPESAPKLAYLWGPLKSAYLGHPDGSVAKLDAQSLKQEQRTSVFGKGETRVRALPGGGLLFARQLGPASKSDNCAILDASTLKVISRFRFDDMASGLQSLDVECSADSRLIALMRAYGKCVSLFDTRSGTLVRTWSMPQLGGEMALSADGSELSVAVDKPTGADEARIEIFDTSTGRSKGAIPTSRAYTLQYTPDGKSLVGASRGGLVVWDVAQRRESGALQMGPGMITRFAFSPDGDRLITTGIGPNTAIVWDVRTKFELVNLSYEPLENPEPGTQNGSDFTRFSDDGKDIYMVCRDGAVRIWHSVPWKDHPNAPRK